MKCEYKFRKERVLIIASVLNLVQVIEDLEDCRRAPGLRPARVGAIGAVLVGQLGQAAPLRRGDFVEVRGQNRPGLGDCLRKTTGFLGEYESRSQEEADRPHPFLCERNINGYPELLRWVELLPVLDGNWLHATLWDRPSRCCCRSCLGSSNPPDPASSFRAVPGDIS